MCDQLSDQLQARSVRKIVSGPRLRLSNLADCAEHHGVCACVFIDSPDRPSSSWVDHYAQHRLPLRSSDLR